MPDAGPHSSIIVAPSILSAGLGRPAEEVLTLPHNIILDFCMMLLDWHSSCRLTDRFSPFDKFHQIVETEGAAFSFSPMLRWRIRLRVDLSGEKIRSCSRE
jgi:hypothetical protein